MNPEQQRALLTVVLYAAFEDGDKHARERDAIRRIAESLANDAGVPDLIRLDQEVLLRRTRLEDAIHVLETSAHRQLAYEMALHVCEADGQVSSVERRFLDQLRSLLGLDDPAAASIEAEAVTLETLSGAAAPATVAGNPEVESPAPRATLTEAELDQSILRYSLLNGALELLPQSWASMAIIPLQIKMVYGIGQAHGVSLDQGHIKEFIAAAGVGLTAQYLEQFGRKLLGGLLGKAAGKTVGKLGGAATGVAFSFATTYALGQLAKRYYAGGRRMDGALLKTTFQDLLGPAKQLQTQYLPHIRQQAESLDMGQVMALVQGR
ncbi:MAG: YcjF family protein [Pseudomonadota bacterium]